MRFINVILAVVVSLVIALGVFEGGLRLIGLGPPKTINQFDAKLGWVKRPNVSTTRMTDEYEVTFAVNKLGLRDDPMESPAKPAGVYRVVCLGDSFTLGFAVAREDLFVDQLETVWNARGQKVDVINTGTEGYSTDQEVRWLLENGDAFQPDLVLLFPYDNDIYWNGQTAYFDREKPRFDENGQLDHAGPFTDTGHGGLDQTTAIGKLFFSKPKLGHRYTPANGSREILSEFAPLTRPAEGFITEAVRRTEGALKALKTKCDDLGARLVVAPIPSHSAVDDSYADKFGPSALGMGSREDWLPELPVVTMMALCERQGIDAIDARQALKDAMAATGQSMYYQRDWHLNAAGNLAFASFLDENLNRLGVFGPDHAPVREADLSAQLLVDHSAPSGMPRWMMWFLGLWVVLTTIYYGTYKDEATWQPPLKVGAMLALIFTIVIGGGKALSFAPPLVAKLVLFGFVTWLICFIIYKLGRRLGTIFELFKSFTLRGHWYLMPLVIVLLSIGSLLVVAASSPLVAPFIYTLF